MGQFASVLSAGMKSTMEEQMKKQMEFQQEAFQMQMERQLVMQVRTVDSGHSESGYSELSVVVNYIYGPFKRPINSIQNNTESSGPSELGERL